MKLTRRYEKMTPEKRPARPVDGWHRPYFRDARARRRISGPMPQAIGLTDAEGRFCIYVPITQDGKVVDSEGYSFGPEDDW
jgi:hypothetical protein